MIFYPVAGIGSFCSAIQREWRFVRWFLGKYSEWGVDRNVSVLQSIVRFGIRDIKPSGSTTRKLVDYINKILQF
jgi:hypothetical protein